MRDDDRLTASGIRPTEYSLPYDGHPPREIFVEANASSGKSGEAGNEDANVSRPMAEVPTYEAAKKAKIFTFEGLTPVSTLDDTREDVILLPHGEFPNENASLMRDATGDVPAERCSPLTADHSGSGEQQEQQPSSDPMHENTPIVEPSLTFKEKLAAWEKQTATWKNREVYEVPYDEDPMTIDSPKSCGSPRVARFKRPLIRLDSPPLTISPTDFQEETITEIPNEEKDTASESVGGVDRGKHSDSSTGKNGACIEEALGSDDNAALNSSEPDVIIVSDWDMTTSPHDESPELVTTEQAEARPEIESKEHAADPCPDIESMEQASDPLCDSGELVMDEQNVVLSEEPAINVSSIEDTLELAQDDVPGKVRAEAGVLPVAVNVASLADLEADEVESNTTKNVEMEEETFESTTQDEKFFPLPEESAVVSGAVSDIMVAETRTITTTLDEGSLEVKNPADSVQTEVADSPHTTGANDTDEVLEMSVGGVLDDTGDKPMEREEINDVAECTAPESTEVPKEEKDEVSNEVTSNEVTSVDILEHEEAVSPVNGDEVAETASDRVVIDGDATVPATSCVIPGSNFATEETVAEVLVEGTISEAVLTSDAKGSLSLLDCEEDDVDESGKEANAEEKGVDALVIDTSAPSDEFQTPARTQTKPSCDYRELVSTTPIACVSDEICHQVAKFLALD